LQFTQLTIIGIDVSIALFSYRAAHQSSTSAEDREHGKYLGEIY
jgi:hypothetical protein